MGISGAEQQLVCLTLGKPGVLPEPPVLTPLYLAALLKHGRVSLTGGSFGEKNHPSFSVLRAGEAEPRSWLRSHLKT